jgi:hypothetical protein
MGQTETTDLAESSFDVEVDVPKRSNVSRVANDARHTEWRGPDRRKPTLKSFIYGAFNPRRRRVRREEDRSSTFVDWYPTHLLVAATVIMCLSVADGLFTVHLINAGAVELNPLLAKLVLNKPIAFALVKIILTGIGVISLVIVSPARLFQRWSMAWVLYGLLIAYVALVVYGYRMSLAIA